MSLVIPPFEPRQACVGAPISSKQRKSTRRLFIFPHYHAALPIGNARCARFRLRRRDLKIRELQLTQIRALHRSIQLVTDALNQVTELQQLFTQVAEVHQITVSYGTRLQESEDLLVECPSSPILVTFPLRSLATHQKTSPENIWFHHHHVRSSDRDGRIFLELASQPTSPLSECSALSMSTPHQSYPSSPLTGLIGLPPLPVPLPPETDTFHCVSMAEFRKLAWNSDRPPEVGIVVNPFKKRRPCRRKRKHSRRKH